MRYDPIDIRAPLGVLGARMPSVSNVRNEFSRLRTISDRSPSGMCASLDRYLCSVAPVALRDSCLLRALEMLACLLRSSSVAWYYFSRIVSCQLK